MRKVRFRHMIAWMIATYTIVAIGLQWLGVEFLVAGPIAVVTEIMVGLVPPWCDPAFGFRHACRRHKIKRRRRREMWEKAWVHSPHIMLFALPSSDPLARQEVEFVSGSLELQPPGGGPSLWIDLWDAEPIPDGVMLVGTLGDWPRRGRKRMFARPRFERPAIGGLV